MLACCEPLRSDGALVEYEPEGRRYWPHAAQPDALHRVVLRGTDRHMRWPSM